MALIAALLAPSLLALLMIGAQLLYFFSASFVLNFGILTSCFFLDLYPEWGYSPLYHD